MKIDFSNPPASARSVASPVQAALAAISASKAPPVVTRASITKAMGGAYFQPSEKSVELYAPTRRATPVVASSAGASMPALASTAGKNMKTLYGFFSV